MQRINNLQSLQKIRFGFLLLFLLLSIHSSYAGNGNAVANGAWNSAVTWLFNSVARTPTCGDTVTVPVGFTVTVSNQQVYGCTTPLLIIVAGTLQFTTGNKLDLPCGSEVRIPSGGFVKKGSGGGNSNLITICNMVEWSAGMGDLAGPTQLGGSTLPIKLLSFTANAKSSGVDLNWATATEINNDYFSVERSVDGKSFVLVEIVKGAGNSTQSVFYSLLDKKPENGLIFYRLKQTDFDGQFSYSAVVPVYFSEKKKFDFVTSENVDAKLNLIINADYENECRIQLSDLAGNQINSMKYLVSKGTNQLELETKQARSGIYLVSVFFGDQLISRKVLL